MNWIMFYAQNVRRNSMPSDIDGLIPRVYVCDICDFKTESLRDADTHQVSTDHSMTRCKVLK